MSEGHNQLDEDLEEVPEPEEITEEEARELPLALDGLESEPDVITEVGLDDIAEAIPDDIAEAIPRAAPHPIMPPNRPPDMKVRLRGAPFGQTRPHHPLGLAVPVFFEQNDIPTIANSVFRKVQGQTRWFVRINSQRLREKRATRRGIALTLEHEVQGHCRGYRHGEANPQVNPAFDPVVRIDTP